MTIGEGRQVPATIAELQDAMKERLAVELVEKAPSELAGQPVARTVELSTKDGFKFFVAEALNVSMRDIDALVLGGHGDDMVPLLRHATVGGVPLTQMLPKDKLDPIVDRTRKGGGELVALYKTGSAYFGPAASAIAMAESFVFDRKRVLPGAAWLEGQYGINGFFMGVPLQIGAGGVEKIIELELNEAEKAELQKSFTSVKKTVDEVKL